VVGEPAVPALAGRGLRQNRSRHDSDPAGQQLGPLGGGWVCSRLSRFPLGRVAVALESPFEPVRLSPFPAHGWPDSPPSAHLHQSEVPVSQSCFPRRRLSLSSPPHYTRDRGPKSSALNQPMETSPCARPRASP